MWVVLWNGGSIVYWKLMIKVTFWRPCQMSKTSIFERLEGVSILPKLHFNVLTKLVAAIRKALAAIPIVCHWFLQSPISLSKTNNQQITIPTSWTTTALVFPLTAYKFVLCYSYALFHIKLIPLIGTLNGKAWCTNHAFRFIFGEWDGSASTGKYPSIFYPTIEDRIVQIKEQNISFIPHVYMHHFVEATKHNQWNLGYNIAPSFSFCEEYCTKFIPWKGITLVHLHFKIYLALYAIVAQNLQGPMLVGRWKKRARNVSMEVEARIILIQWTLQ